MDIFEDRILVRRDTLANFVAQGVVPQNGEPVGIIGADGKATAYKIGDGISTVDQLPTLSKGDKGDKGDAGTNGAQGLPGTNAVPSDSAVAGYISTTGTSATKTALGASFVGDAILAASGIDNTGTSDSTAAIKALLDANPSRTFWVPPGSYRLNSGLVISKSNGLVLSPNARIFAGAAMDTLIAYAPSLPNGQYAEDKGIVGGVLDGANLANKVLTIATVLRFTLTRTTILDGINRGLVTLPGVGAEILAYDLRFAQTGTSNLTDNVAIDNQMGDNHFSNIIIRDWVIGVRDNNGGRWDKIHPWISGNGIANRYPGSVAFDLTNASNLTNCYADTYQTGFRINASSGRPRLRNVRAAWSATLPDSVATANPSYVFDNTAGVGVFCYGLDVSGRSVAPASFINGSSAKMNVFDAISGGNVNGVQQYRGGVAFGVTTFTPNVFGSTAAGTQTYGSRSGYMDVADGFVTYRFTVTVTFGGDITGNLRIGGLPMVPGAASVNIGQGPINTASGIPNMRSVIGANGSSTPLVATPQDIVGAEISSSGLGGTTVTIRGSITCPFSYA